ncbi:MAG: hypothetical protein IPN17_01305 [Deltaproteobacteria bacterium]|nr:hypothetical protein [Deltaproteobacteria bacterium]
MDSDRGCASGRRVAPEGLRHRDPLRDDEQWSKCYVEAIEEANRFLSAIGKVVRRIEADGDKAGTRVEGWLRRLEQ